MTGEKTLRAIRGAVCCENSEESICDAVKSLFEKIFAANDFSQKDAVCVQFTVTRDLTEINPAAALRKAGFFCQTPLFCAAEPEYKGSLPCTIRTMILAYMAAPARHIYCNGAEVLRLDIASERR